MSLGVNGYLELYTTLLGWQQYANLWDIAWKSGAVFLPFLALILRNISDPMRSQETRSASATSLKRMEFDLAGLFFVVILCAQPTIPLEPTALNYTPICQQQTQPATPGNTGTTYDQNFPVATGAKVPVIWYAVMALSHAITRAAILGLPCQPLDYRQLHDTLMASKIQDPALRQEATDFYQDCYVQALAKYDRDKPDVSPYTQNTGNADTQWLGSQAFQQMPGYYDSLSASKPVTGFPFDPNRDFEYGDNHGQWGRPSCQQWWSDSQNGLETRLAQALPKPVFSFIEGKQTAEDSAVKTLIQLTYSTGYQSLNDEDSGNIISKHIGAPIGIAMEKMTYYPKLMLIKEALPNIQAVCLMFIYIFLAFAQPFALYRVKAISITACIIFSITFWTFIWYAVDYVDQNLIQALYPDLLSEGVSSQQDLVDMVIGTCYILGPVLWSSLLCWIGVQAGSSLAAAIGGGAAPAMEAGARAGALGQQALTMAVNQGLGAMKTGLPH